MSEIEELLDAYDDADGRYGRAIHDNVRNLAPYADAKAKSRQSLIDHSRKQAENLGQLAEKYKASEIRWMNIVTKLKQEQADEIRRLQAELAEAKAFNGALRTEQDELEAENDKVTADRDKLLAAAKAIGDAFVGRFDVNNFAGPELKQLREAIAGR
jgi:chromosome segregation ATPase